MAGHSTKKRGDDAEAHALAYLQQQGLRLLQRNYRTPGRGGGEIDLIMQAADKTIVFVEVRSRSSQRYGGAAASVGNTKQRRIVLAARHYLARLGRVPPCRFDLVISGPDGLQWLCAAFDAGRAP